MQRKVVSEAWHIAVTFNLFERGRWMRLLYDNTLKFAITAMVCAVGYSSPAMAQDEAASQPAAEAATEAAEKAADAADDAAEAAQEAAEASKEAAEEAAEASKAAAEAAATEAAAAAQPASESAAEAAADPAAAAATVASNLTAEEEPEQIVIVGSRRVMRSVLDSPTPVDMVAGDDFTAQGTTDMDGLLRTLIPSYNVSPQPISDAATLSRPANLRGLPPDSTVVLVNGKRRHRGAIITFLGSGLSDGSQGVDLAPIPALALKRVEVLRDGAAAQYGSDAIAGVMNFVLRDDSSSAMVVTKVGSTYEGDGTAWSVAGNVGLPLTDRGFFNFTIEYGNSDPTSRSVQRTDAAQLIADGNDAVRNPAQIWGSPEVSDDLKIFANMGIEIADGVRVYAFGNVARRDVLGGFFFRNPTNRGAVYSGDGGETLLVGDVTPDGSGNCPTVNVNNGVIDQAALQSVIDDPNCFVFNELFPGGFTPNFGGRVLDMSIAGGIRGITDFGLSWDLSASVGQNEADFKIVNTVNASLGPQTPTEFTPGTYSETDQTFNLDLAYPLDIGAFSPLTVAAGAEYRQEVFTVVAGDSASFEIGPLVDQGFSIGSNGFPGFSNDIAGDFDRRNIAGYIDLTTDIVEAWTVQVAGRVESFDTFGTQAVVKASTRIGLGGLFGMDYGDNFALRGAVGTGFRAPSAGQTNVSNISTVATGNVLVNRGTVPPSSAVAQEVGAEELDPETSVNITGGVVLSLSDFFSLTVDYYNIAVKDRISQSATQQLTPEQAQRLEDEGIRGATDLSEFRFFTNAFDTTTQGIDVVATSNFDLGDAGRVQLNFVYAWNETQVDSFIEGVIDDQRVSELEDAIPNHRFTLTGNYSIGPIRLLLRGSFYDEFSNPSNASSDLSDLDEFTFGSTFLVDAEIGYSFFDDHFMLVAGAANIFDVVPDENPADFQGGLGAVYPENSPIGFNGGFWYFRLQAQL